MKNLKIKYLFKYITISIFILSYAFALSTLALLLIIGLIYFLTYNKTQFKAVHIKNIFIATLIVALIYIMSLHSIQEMPNTKNIEVTVVNKLTYYENMISFIGKVDDNRYLIKYYCNSECPNFKYGDKLIIDDFKTTPIEKKYNNPSSFDKVTFYRSMRLKYEITIRSFNLIEPNFLNIYSIKNIRNQLMENNINKLGSTSKIVNGLIFGQLSLSDEYKDILKSTSTNHLFVISGAHIFIFIIIIESILGFFSFPHKISIYSKSIILFIYSFLAGFTYPVTRAIFATIIVEHSKIEKEITNYILFIVFFLHNPLAIHSLSYKLTFLISFLIPYISTYCEKYSVSKFYKVLIFNYLIYIILIPFTLNLNYTFNIFAPIATVISSTLITLVIIPLSILVTILPVNIILISLINLCTTLLIFILKNLSFYSITVGHISFITSTILICCYINIYLYNKFIYKILILLIITLKIVNFNILGFISIVDIGQGDSILIQFPLNGDTVLIDTGPPAAKNEITNYLKYEGINTIDTLIVTHEHSDHNGNVSTIDMKFDVKNIITSRKHKNYDSNIISNNFKFNLGNKDVNFIISDNNNENENINSIAFTIEIGKYNWFFGGDIEEENELYIMQNYKLEDIYFYKVSHHGSKTSSSNDFIDYLAPEYAIISSGKNNMYNHPSEITINTLQNNNVGIHNTQIDGMYKGYFIGPFYLGDK